MRDTIKDATVFGYKKLSNPELGRTSQTHIGLSNGFLSFLNDDNNYTLQIDKCSFYFNHKLYDSSCTINCITREDGLKENPKVISGGSTQGTVVKRIKAIATGINKEYYLVWKVSVEECDFLLIEKDTADFSLINNLEVGDFDDSKAALIEAEFGKQGKVSIRVILEDKYMTSFSLKTLKYLIDNFGEDFIKENLEEDISKIADVKLKMPNYFGTPMVFGCFDTETSFKSKSKKKFHDDNLKILGKEFIYFTNQFTEEFNPTAVHCSMDRFINFVSDYSKKQYSVIKEDGKYKLISNKAIFSRQVPIQKIFFGPPGSGKSHLIKSRYPGSWPRVTFHPELDYQGFVGAYKPTVEHTPNGEQITYKFVEEAFLRAYCASWKSDKPYYLIIEEINRGNCAQIFGDIFQLLDRGDDGFSEYPIICSPDIQRHLKKELKGITRLQQYTEKTGAEDFSRMSLPDNLNILCTMNTSDQSLFPMDSAFKRRWDWQYVPIDYKDAENFRIDLEDGKKEINWGKFIEAINIRIKEHTQSEDKQIGNRFVSPPNNRISKEQFVSKVVFYLWSEIYKEEHGGGLSVFPASNKGQDGLTFSDFFNRNGEVDTEITRRFIEFNLPEETENSAIKEGEIEVTEVEE